MNYNNLVLDFIDRTQKNLEFIEQAARFEKDSQVFEVTQLINSLLGLIVFPRENYYENIPETPLAELEAQGWKIPAVSGQFEQVKNLRQLMRYLRNAIAHSNLEFDSDGVNLTGIRLWNCSHGKKTWEVRWPLAELRDLTFRFIELLRQEQNQRLFVKATRCQEPAAQTGLAGT